MLEILLYVSIGLATFFAGLHIAEQGLVKGTGSKLKKILEFFTSSLLSAILTGAIVTALVQSSSAVSVMVIGFVSGGVISLYQGMGVIIGANIGTTVTIHILSLKVQNLEWGLCAIGIILILIGLFQKRSGLRYSGFVFLGFGLIFFGLTFMQNGLLPLKYNPRVMRWLMNFTTRPFMGIVAGMGLTAMIQSSSATSGIVLMIARQGMLSLMGAIGMILGSEVGTCVTALLAGLKAQPVARRIAYFHLILNVFGVLLFIPMLQSFSLLIGQLDLELGRQIAVAQTAINITTAIAIIPFVKPLERLLSI